MIDIESYIFTKVEGVLRDEFEGVFVTGEAVRDEPDLPCVSIVESDNATNTSTRDSSLIENHAVLMYQVDAYSGLETGKKSQCRALIACADDVFQKLGFVRIMMNPTPNLEAPSIYRITARYRAVVSKDWNISS